MRALHIIPIAFLSSPSVAQTMFQETLGDTIADIGSAIQQTADGGYILAGTSACAPPLAVYLIKVDALGSLVQTRYFMFGGNDGVAGVRQSTDGGYAVVGYTYSGSGLGGRNVHVMKTAPGLGLQWSIAVGGAAHEEGRSIREVNGGGYVVAGHTASFSAGSMDMYLVRLDATGTLLWTRSIGGPDQEDCYAVQQTTDGGFILAGYTESWGAGWRDVLLVKTDMNGTAIWQRAIGGAGQDEAHALVQCPDGGYLVAGTTTSFGAGGMDVYLMKVDSMGTLLWSRAIGDAGDDQVNAAVSVGDGGFFVAGQSIGLGPGGGEASLMKTDSTGALLWSKTYGGPTIDIATGLDRTSDGGAALLGTTFSFSATDADFYLIKTDAAGNSGCNEMDPPMQSAPVTSTITVVTATEGTGGSPVIWSPMGGTIGTAQPLCLITGVEDRATLSVAIDVRPIPSFGMPEITITSPRAAIARITVHDAVGRSILDRAIYLVGGQQLIPLTVELQSGSYVLGLRTEAECAVKRFVLR